MQPSGTLWRVHYCKLISVEQDCSDAKAFHFNSSSDCKEYILQYIVAQYGKKREVKTLQLTFEVKSLQRGESKHPEHE